MIFATHIKKQREKRKAYKSPYKRNVHKKAKSRICEWAILCMCSKDDIMLCTVPVSTAVFWYLNSNVLKDMANNGKPKTEAQLAREEKRIEKEKEKAARQV